MKKTPTIGRMVIYRPTATDRQSIGGNNENKECPATIVAVWGDTPEAAVNLKVHGDGPNDVWVTSKHCGEGPGTWSWPEIVLSGANGPVATAQS